MSKSEIVRFVARFACEAVYGVQDPDLACAKSKGIANDALALLRLASQHKRLCELECSVPEPLNGPKWAEQSTKVQVKIRALLKPYGMGVTFSGDPRGATVKLVLPSGYTDDMGREGFIVPSVGYSAAQLDRIAK